MPVVFAADAVPEEITVSAKRLEEELPQDLARTGTRVDTVTAEQVQNVGYLDFVPGSALEYYFGYDLQKYGGRDQVLVITQKDETTHAVFGQIRTSDSWLPNARLAAGVRYYLDPVSGDILKKVDGSAQAYRWLHEGLHRLDFTEALRSRPVWDALILVLITGVTLICISGCYFGALRVTGRRRTPRR